MPDHTLRLMAEFRDLVGPTTAAHIHAPTATPFSGVVGVATQTPNFLLFPVGVTLGTFDQILDLTAAASYNPAFLAANGGTPAGAEAALAASLAEGRAYFNVHTSIYPGGEIRGFFARVPDRVPDSMATAPLLLLNLLALLGFATIGRGKRSSC